MSIFWKTILGACLTIVAIGTAKWSGQWAAQQMLHPDGRRTAVSMSVQPVYSMEPVKAVAIKPPMPKIDLREFHNGPHGAPNRQINQSNAARSTPPVRRTIPTQRY